MGSNSPRKGRTTQVNMGQEFTEMVVTTCSKELYYLLKKPVDLEKLRPHIERCEEYMVMFIRGLADAEGMLTNIRDILGHMQIDNTD